jgi:hypothetical protein
VLLSWRIAARIAARVHTSASPRPPTHTGSRSSSLRRKASNASLRSASPLSVAAAAAAAAAAAVASPASSSYAGGGDDGCGGGGGFKASKMPKSRRRGGRKHKDKRETKAINRDRTFKEVRERGATWHVALQYRS